MKNKKKGFTLIELLVVLAVIALLVRIGVSIFQPAQTKTKDAKRKQDLQSIGVALEIYAQGHNLQYIQGASATHSCTDTADTQALYTNIADYMANKIVPKDPQTQAQYCYYALNNGTSYRLFTKLENCIESGSNFLCQFQTWNYSVYSNDLSLAGATGDTPVDIDGDTYQAGTQGTTCPNGKLCDCYDASGGSTIFCDGGTHTLSYCTHPGQGGYFTATRGTSAQGNDFAGNTWNSYDYNCDQTETKLYTCVTTFASAVSCQATMPSGQTGYVGSVASCGQTATWRECFGSTTATCSPGSGNGCASGGVCYATGPYWVVYQNSRLQSCH